MILRFKIVGSMWVLMDELGFEHRLWYCILLVKFVKF